MVLPIIHGLGRQSRSTGAGQYPALSQTKAEPQGAAGGEESCLPTFSPSCSSSTLTLAAFLLPAFRAEDSVRSGPLTGMSASTEQVPHAIPLRQDRPWPRLPAAVSRLPRSVSRPSRFFHAVLRLPRDRWWPTDTDCQCISAQTEHVPGTCQRATAARWTAANLKTGGVSLTLLPAR